MADCAGETIPASDSEDEDRRGEGNLEGAHRESEEWVMRQLATERGITSDVVEALADRLDASTCEFLRRAAYSLITLNC